MPSNTNVFVDAGFIEDGFFESVEVVVEVPVVIDVGVPGAAKHTLPFRALGGSVVDLDLLYGVLGRQATLEDIQPLWVLGSRQGLLRSFGFEIPRTAIQQAVIEHYATLLEIEDVTIEASPVGTNLFGFIGLTTRPMSSVTLSNADGYWSQLVLRELIMNSPAGLFVDIAHTAVMPILTGTVSGYTFAGNSVVIRYGFQARRKNAPSVRD